MYHWSIRMNVSDTRSEVGSNPLDQTYDAWFMNQILLILA